MTKEERQLVRTCMGNGYEFHRRRLNKTTVKIGETEIDFDWFCAIAEAVELALDTRTPKRPVDDYCPTCGSKVATTNFCCACGQCLDWSAPARAED